MTQNIIQELSGSSMRSVRSYVIRAGRMGSGQQRALDQLGGQFVLPFESRVINFDQLFGRSAPLVIEIGFGMGQATALMAEQFPERNFLGIEVHAPGVGALLKEIQARQLRNIRIVAFDAVEVLTHMVALDSVAAIHIFFPDPWPKKKHHKRRLIQAPFVELMTSRLAQGGVLHCATDWAPYAQQIKAVLTAQVSLANTTDGFAPRPIERPITKFEKRGLQLGHGVWDLLFARCS